MVSEANEPGSESGKRSDDRRGAARGTRAGSWTPQEGGASNHSAARLPPRSPGSFAAAAMVNPDSLLAQARQLGGEALGGAGDPRLCLGARGGARGDADAEIAVGREGGGEGLEMDAGYGAHDPLDRDGDDGLVARA